MINENNDAFIIRIQQSTQPFVYLDKANYFEFQRTVLELCLDETTVEEYNGLDFGGKDCLTIFPFKTVF